MSTPFNSDSWNDYTTVDMDDNKYAVRYSPTLPTQIRTPAWDWREPVETLIIRKLAMALHAANEEIEELEVELQDISMRHRL